MSFIGTAKVSTNAFRQLLCRQQPIGFDDSSLAMHPFGFDRIKPGALRWEPKGQDTDSLASAFDLVIMLSDPGLHDLADMPGSVVPDQQPGPFALRRQPITAPVEKLGGHVADGASGDKAQPHLVTYWLVWGPGLPQHSITGQGLWVGSAFFAGLLHQTHRMGLVLPGVHARARKATPPHLVEEANGPVLLDTGPSNQAVACVFFSRYCGSGLVIQCLARFQLVLSRLRARRTLSSDTGTAMMPCSKLTWAASSSVQVLRCLPNSLGRRCSRSFSCWSPSSEKLGCKRWGREEPACSTASPAVLKPWITLRTVWSSQPSCLAIAMARSPRALASKIWQRRRT